MKETTAEIQQPKIYHVEIENPFGTGALFALGVVLMCVVCFLISRMFT